MKVPFMKKACLTLVSLSLLFCITVGTLYINTKAELSREKEELARYRKQVYTLQEEQTLILGELHNLSLQLETIHQEKAKP